jgi:hypothetical protein
MDSQGPDQGPTKAQTKAATKAPTIMHWPTEGHIGDILPAIVGHYVLFH